MYTFVRREGSMVPGIAILLVVLFMWADAGFAADVEMSDVTLTSGGVTFSDSTTQATAGQPAFVSTVVIGDQGSNAANGSALNGKLDALAPSSTARYVIRLEPGTYDVGNDPVDMKSYVDIEGSGRGVTIITGTVDGATTGKGIVTGADNAELRNLTVINTGGGTDAFAILNDGVSPKISDVTAQASGGSGENTGILNENGALPTLRNVTATGTGGTDARGVAFSNGSVPADPAYLFNVTATAENGSTSNYGMYFNLAKAYCWNGTGTGSDSGTAATNNGIYATGSGTNVELYGTTGEASGGTTNHGLRAAAGAEVTAHGGAFSATGGSGDNYGTLSSGSTVTIMNAAVSGDTKAVYTISTISTDGVSRIAGSRLAGGTGKGIFGSPTNTCAGVVDETSFTFSDLTCP